MERGKETTERRTYGINGIGKSRVKLDEKTAEHHLVHPCKTMPYQGFAFLPDGGMATMMSTDSKMAITKKELDGVYQTFPYYRRGDEYRAAFRWYEPPHNGASMALDFE